jgi:hypothetical protein
VILSGLSKRRYRERATSRLFPNNGNYLTAGKVPRNHADNNIELALKTGIKMN